MKTLLEETSACSDERPWSTAYPDPYEDIHQDDAQVDKALIKLSLVLFLVISIPLIWWLW